MKAAFIDPQLSTIYFAPYDIITESVFETTDDVEEDDEDNGEGNNESQG